MSFTAEWEIVAKAAKMANDIYPCFHIDSWHKTVIFETLEPVWRSNKKPISISMRHIATRRFIYTFNVN